MCMPGPCVLVRSVSLDKSLSGSGYNEPEIFTSADWIQDPKVVPLEL